MYAQKIILPCLLLKLQAKNTISAS